MIDKAIQDKIEKAFENDFVGNYLGFTDDELETLYEYVGSLLREVGSYWGVGISSLEYKTIFVALVELTKEWSSNEDAWLNYIAKKLLGSSFELSGKIYTQITKAISFLAETGKIFILDSFQKKYYATVCCHAFTPKFSLNSFFDMCWEIYCKDMDQQYSAYSPILQIIAESLKNRLLYNKNEDDDVQIGSKVYAFRVGIKGLILDQQDILINILNDTLQAIDALMQSQPISEDTYFKKIIGQWWREKEDKFGVVPVRKQREHIVFDYKQIKPKYVLKNAHVKIKIPSVYLKEYSESCPHIKIMIGEKVVLEDYIPIRPGSGIVRVTQPFEIDLDSLDYTGKLFLSVNIDYLGESIYDSRRALFRDFILFYGEKETIASELFPGEYFLYAPKLEIVQTPKDIARINKRLYSINAVNGEMVQCDGRVVFFEVEKTNKNIFFVVNERRDLMFKMNESLYRIIDGELCLDIDPNMDLKDIGIKYLGATHIKLNDFPYSVEPNGRRRYTISALVDVGQPTSLSVFRYSDGNILDVINILKFNDINIQYDKKLYYGENIIGHLVVQTEKFHLEAEFNINDDEYTIPFSGGEIVFEPPILKWKFDNGQWYTVPIAPIYYKLLTNSSLLELKAPFGFNCTVGLTAGNLVAIEGKPDTYSIGQTIYSLTSKQSLDDVTLFVRLDNETYELARIFLVEKIIEDPISVESEKYTLFWTHSLFVGDSRSELLLEICLGNQTLDTKTLPLLSDKTFVFPSLFENRYRIRIILKGHGPLQKNKCIFEKHIVFGDYKSLRFKGKYLEIYKAMIMDKAYSEEIKPIYVAKLKYLGEKDNASIYSGQIFIKKAGNRIYLNTMNDNKNRSIHVNPIRIELKTLYTCYIGYGLDEHDSDFEYDNEFAISRDGYTILSDSVTNVKTADYYYFKELDEGGVGNV